MFSCVCILAAARAEWLLSVLSYYPAKAGISFFSVFACHLSSRTPLNASREHILKVAQIIWGSGRGLCRRREGNCPKGSIPEIRTHIKY